MSISGLILNPVTAGILLTLCFLRYHWKRWDLYKFSWGCNGPWSWPIIGSALSLSGTPEEITIYFSKMYNDYKTPILDWFGPYPVYYVKEPEEAMVMFNSQHLLHKSILYKAVNWTFGDSILSTFHVDKWKRHRRALAPSFSAGMLETYGLVFQKRAVELVKDLKKYAGEGTFNIIPEMEKYSLGNLTETIMGRILDEDSKDDQKYLSSLERLKDYASGLTVSLLFYIKYLEKIVHLTDLYKTASIIIGDIYNFVGKVMRERRLLRIDAQDKIESIHVHKKDLYNRQYFIDKLLDLTGDGLTFSDKEAFDQIFIFIAAGGDTCAYTYANVCLMLGMNQEHQEMAYREVMDLVGDSDRPITKDDVQHLPFIERFVKETLRLFPVANAIGRESTDEVLLGGRTVPKGVNVVLNLIEYHRDPRFWDEPLEFNPDRFLPDEVAKRHPYTYVPFSAGPRNCIGYKYGLIILVMTTASLVRAYRFGSPFKKISELQFGMAIVTRLLQGHLVEIEERSRP